MENLQITLRAARNNIGFSRKQAAVLFGLHEFFLQKWEADSSDVYRTFYLNIEKVYGVPVENIYFGDEKEYHKNLREKLAVSV
jgi:DNA-binding XRE family transcriptional regulator